MSRHAVAAACAIATAKYTTDYTADAMRPQRTDCGLELSIIGKTKWRRRHVVKNKVD